MADNVTLPGTGVDVAADDVGGALYQRVKIAVGADGAAADLAPGQATMAGSLPVAIASNQSAIPVTDNSGSLTVDSAQLPVALAAGGGLKVEGVSGGVAVSIGGAAADDAAASGNPVSIGGIYQATVDSVDDGDIGRLRMTARRGLVTAAEHRTVFLVDGYGYTEAMVGDLTATRSATVNTGSYVSPAATHVLGTDGAFDTTPVRIRIPMTHWQQCSIGVYNGLGVAVTLSVEQILSSDGDNGGSHSTIYSASLANGAFINLMPAAGGTGAAYNAAVPALANPALFFQVSITPDSDPSSGEWRLHVVRR